MSRSYRSSTRAVPVGVFLVLAAAFAWLWLQASGRQRRALAQDTELLAQQAALRLEEVGRTVQEVAHHMRTAWSSGDATLGGFDRFASQLAARNPEVMAINWVSPGGVIEHVHPRNEANLRALGKDLDEKPQAAPYLARARQAGEGVVFTAPADLYQGRVGVAAYLPMGERQGEGFVNVVFSLDAMIARLGDSVLDTFDLTLGCTGLDGHECWYGPGGLDDRELLERPIQARWPFRLAPNDWQLVLSPRADAFPSGPGGEEDLFLIAGLGLALALALVVRRELLSRGALEVSERRYRNVVRDLPDFICRYRPDGEITFVNEAFAQRFGRTAPELVGTSLFDLYAPAQAEDLRRSLAELRPGDAIETHRYIAAEEGRPRRWERWHERALGGPAGGVAEVQSIGFDVTEAREAEERLRHSQERYRTLVESSPDGVLIHRDGRVLFANDSLASLVGAQGTWQLAGLPLHEIVPKLDERRAAERENELIARGGTARLDDEHVRHRDGRLIDVEVIANRVVFDGQPAVQAILRDVTERRQAERALRDSEERFRTIFGSISDGVLIHDRDGALLEVNESACALFGLSREVMCRLDAGALVADGPASRVEAVRERFAAACTPGEPQRFEFLARRGKGEIWWAEVSLRAARISGRERLLAVVRDVTERRAAQEALTAARNRLDHLLSTGPTVIYSRTPGPSSRLTFVSRNVSRLVGLSSDELLGDRGRWRAAVHESDRVRVDGELGDADARGDRFTCEYRVLRADGEELWIQDDARLLRDERGDPVEWVGSWRDVTARKRGEHSQRLMMAELDHRVKNTLAMVLSLLEQTLARGGSTAELRGAFRGRVEALARAHEALAQERWESVSLETMARLVLGPHVEGGRASLAGPPTPLEARMASPLALALHELGTNAAKHGALAAEGGRVDLSWAREARGLVLTWRERGGPPVTPPTGPGGSGLSLVRGLIEHEIGGRVVFDFDEPGLQVEMVLPLGEGAARPQLLV